jgi:cytochrome c oxidase subunit 3
MSQAQPAAQGAEAVGYQGRFTLAHHFDTPTQQYDSDKLGMWLFLVTEILLFGGLFCAYSVYRANHPDIFLFAHTFLDKTLGGINTMVLIFSSFTMAWAVRAAQLGQRRLLPVLLTVTLLCGFGFLGIKGVEYNHKWKHGLLWGKNFDYAALEHGAGHGAEHAGAPAAAAPGAESANHEAASHDDAGGDEAAAHDDAAAAAGAPGATATDVEQPAAAQEDAIASIQSGAVRPVGEGYREATTRSNLAQSALAPSGLRAAVAQHAEHGALQDIPRNVHVFFGIYFVMTGLHALHVIAGMIVIGWLLVRALRGDFGTRNFVAVDLGGLYWHLVDLIWIFLFPLLYLIH